MYYHLKMIIKTLSLQECSVKLKMLIFRNFIVYYYYYELICSMVLKGVFLFYQGCLRSYLFLRKIWDADIFALQNSVFPKSEKNLICNEVPGDEIFCQSSDCDFG